MDTAFLSERVLQLDDWDEFNLAMISQPGIDMAIINRSTFPKPGEEVVSIAEVDSIRCVTDRRNLKAKIEFALRELALVQCNTLADDMHQLGLLFMNHFAIEHANLRIEVVDSQSCPKFHCDARQIRLITTYAGPTTEYRLCDPDAENQAVALGSIALLKGTTHPTHEGEHVLHRSPPMTTGQRRLCLVIDY